MGGEAVGDKLGGDTYGSIVDETGGWRVVGVVMFVVIIVVVVMPMIGVFGGTEFRGWNLDVKRGKGFAETRDGRNRASVGLKS